MKRYPNATDVFDYFFAAFGPALAFWPVAIFPAAGAFAEVVGATVVFANISLGLALGFFGGGPFGTLACCATTIVPADGGAGAPADATADVGTKPEAGCAGAGGRASC